MATSRMKAWFPTTSSPLIVSAPMDFITNARMASEVSKAGGLGFIQGGRDFTPGCQTLKTLEMELTLARQTIGLAQKPQETLPIGVGFVTYPASISSFGKTTTPILQRHRPAAVWLFAPDPSAPRTIAEVIATLRSVDEPWGLKIAVQVGTVAAARQAAKDGADIIVAQGIDAGGHQWAKGAGIISLVPEIVDMLAEEFPGREILVWAAGGLADGRGVAASIALGAEAAVLGTRFMVATESDAQEYKRKAILETADGGANTAKSQLHDHVQGNMTWPDIYDGRAVVHPAYTDHLAGMSLEGNQARYKAAKEQGDLSGIVTWSGTGVGLIREALPAGQIVKQVRDEALKVMDSMKPRL